MNSGRSTEDYGFFEEVKRCRQADELTVGRAFYAQCGWRGDGQSLIVLLSIEIHRKKYLSVPVNIPQFMILQYNIDDIQAKRE